MRCVRSLLAGGLGAAVLLAPEPVAAAPASASELASGDLLAASLYLAVGAWLVGGLLWFRYGREVRQAVEDATPSLTLLDDPPAVVSVLHHRIRVAPSVVGVVTLDLARRGYVGIVEELEDDLAGESRPGWRFVRRETPGGELRPYENAVYARLFTGRGETNRAGLEGWARESPAQARVFLERIERYLTAELSERGYLTRNHRLPVVVNLLLGALVALLGLVALLEGAWLGVLALVSGAGQVGFSRYLRHRTVSGAERAGRWEEVGRALARIDETEAVADADGDEWDRYLVYACALGVGSEFVEAIRRSGVPAAVAEELAGWYESDRSGPERLATLARLPGELASTLSGGAAPAAEPAHRPVG